MDQNSEVLDTFVAATAASDPDRAEPLQRELESITPAVDEKTLAIRCLTTAAQSWRDLIGADHQAEPIDSGAKALFELEFLETFPIGPPQETVKSSLSEALGIAADRLGPIPARGLGSIKAPGESPRMVPDVRPTQRDLVEMARRSGATLGLASAHGTGDPLAALREIARDAA